MRLSITRRTAALALSVGIAAAPMALFASPASASAAGPGQAVVVSGSAAASVDAVGGSGGYVFTPTACVTAGPAGAGACTVTVSQGHFSNIVCGTGSADGIITVSLGSTTLISGPFSITFAAGVGVFTMTDADGVVQIAPLSPVAPPGCVTGFQVTAAAVSTG